MPSLLVTGANRGIGLEFVRQYAADGWCVHAACRDPDAAAALRALAGDVAIHALDVIDAASIAALAAGLDGAPIDVLINNAGVYGPRGKGLGETDYAAWAEVLRVNLLGPFAVTEALADNLAVSERKLAVAISSRMGSTGLLVAPTVPIYDSSKAGLNMAMRCLARMLASRGITTVIFTPGHVRTDMGGARAPLGVDESVSGMRAVIAHLGPDDNGKFLDHEGAEVPW